MCQLWLFNIWIELLNNNSGKSILSKIADRFDHLTCDLQLFNDEFSVFHPVCLLRIHASNILQFSQGATRAWEYRTINTFWPKLQRKSLLARAQKNFSRIWCIAIRNQSYNWDTVNKNNVFNQFTKTIPHVCIFIMNKLDILWKQKV